MTSALPLSRRFLLLPGPSSLIANKTKLVGNRITRYALHSLPLTLARKSSPQAPQVYDVSEENVTGPIKPTQTEKFKPLPLVPIPDQKLIEYATFCFEKPAKFIGSVGDSNPEESPLKWPKQDAPRNRLHGRLQCGEVHPDQLPSQHQGARQDFQEAGNPSCVPA